MTESVNKVTNYIDKHPNYSDILYELRKILMSEPLSETIKWGMPVYVHEKTNLFGIGGFNNHASLWFFQGVLLKDKHKILHNAQEGKTKAMRQIHFESLDNIDKPILLNYIQESINYKKQGIIIKSTKNTNKIVIPKELLLVFKSNNKLKKAFNEFSLAKQREYTNHIISAKKETTKLARIEKIIPLILNKKGLYDKYKNC